MQTLTGFARKYAIMEELDSGFSSGSTPEAFVRLDSWEGRIQASVHVKGLKQGPFNYMLYLIFAKNNKLIPILAGPLNVSYNGMQNGLEIDAEILAKHGVRPEAVRFAAITAESRDRKWIPLFSSFEKSYKWDESIRQVLLSPYKEQVKAEDSVKESIKESVKETIAQKPLKEEPKSPIAKSENILDVLKDDVPSKEETPLISPAAFMPQEEKKSEELKAHSKAASIFKEEPQIKEEFKEESKLQDYNSVEKISEKFDEPKVQEPFKAQDILNSHQEEHTTASKDIYGSRDDFYKDLMKKDPSSKCDIDRLEGLMRNNFEKYMPFKRASRGYTWYKVSDLAMLSNIMYQAGVNVPIFANPKILVGLFKFKHVLAGIYRGDDGSNYYVIGVPAKNENDNRPFENACRWVPLPESSNRDMGGYWLVYVSMKTGEIVV
ncbi:MAG: hypothetical protein GXX10_05370 [Clostridiaceae bacterium]|nr:hypothetical protein [Clostridiaceae bacterium]